MTTHNLKVWPPFFDAIDSQIKPFDVRHNDRGFQVGDWLELREWDPFAIDGDGYTGRDCTRWVSYVLRATDVPAAMTPGYVVLGLAVSPGRPA